MKLNKFQSTTHRLSKESPIVKPFSNKKIKGCKHIEPTSFLDEFSFLPEKFLSSPRYYLESVPFCRRAVLEELLTIYVKTNSVYPSLLTLADRVGCSERHALRVVKRLESDGFLLIDRAHRRSNRYLPHPVFNNTKMRSSLKGLFNCLRVIPLVISMACSVTAALQPEYVDPLRSKREIYNTINLTCIRRSNDLSSFDSLVNRFLKRNKRREEITIPEERPFTKTRKFYEKNMRIRRAKDADEAKLRFLRRDTLFAIDRKKVLNGYGIALKKKNNTQKRDLMGSVLTFEERKRIMEPKRRVPYHKAFIPKVEVKVERNDTIYEKYFYVEDNKNPFIPWNPYKEEFDKSLEEILVASTITRESLILQLRKIYDAK